MEASYERVRRLLFGALSNLARQGFVVPPTEALDLIQDFFVEAWNGLMSRYDPAKSKMETYVYEAFVHFARPRIVRLQRWQSRLVDAAELARLVAEQPTKEHPVESWHDLHATRDALLHLPPREKEVLLNYLLSSPRSERKLAEKFSVSRYCLRETLVEALGRVAVLLGERAKIPGQDWKVAVALWKEGRTLQEASAYLGQTVHQVREARFRILKALAEGLKYSNPASRSHLRRRTMKHEIKVLWEKVLGSPGNRHLLKEVSARGSEVLRYLEHIESSPELGTQMGKCDPQWVAEIFGSLAGDEVLSPEDLETMDALFKANLDHEVSIGYAFAEALMEGIPEHLKDLRRWLKDLPRVEENEQRRLANQAVVQAGKPYAEMLVPCGMTPLTIFYASEAVPMLLERLIRDKAIPSDRPLVIDPNQETSRESVTLEMIVQEIGQVAECSKPAARILMSWLTGVAQFKPFLFNGFEAEAMGKAIRLSRALWVESDLYKRWGLPFKP